MNSIKIPLRCANCNYPDTFGSIIEAEIKYSNRDQLIVKHWNCPKCKSTTTIEFKPKQFEANPLKAIFSIKSNEDETPKKGLEDLIAGGGVEKID
uniref:Uncharacterized protein n=1 Tax=viral metagenome TaxID=1070528 RepID=A0A6H1ZMN4_9ZZZZ